MKNVFKGTAFRQRLKEEAAAKKKAEEEAAAAEAAKKNPKKSSENSTRTSQAAAAALPPDGSNSTSNIPPTRVSQSGFALPPKPHASTRNEGIRDFANTMSAEEISERRGAPQNTLNKLRKSLLKFYHHPNNLMFAATKVEQQDPLLCSSAMVPVFLREVFQSDLSKTMVEIGVEDKEEPEFAPEIKHKTGSKEEQKLKDLHKDAGDKSRTSFNNTYLNRYKAPEAYKPKLVSEDQPKLTKTSLKNWCEDLFLAPLVEKKTNFKTYANPLFQQEQEKLLKKEENKKKNQEREKKSRFEALVESIPGAGKTELAKRICLEQPFENALAIYLPLSRINYTPNEVNEFDELLELALGCTVCDGPDPEKEYKEMLKKQKEEEERLQKEKEKEEKKAAGEATTTDGENESDDVEDGVAQFRWPGEHADDSSDEDNNNMLSDGEDDVDEYGNPRQSSAAGGPITGNLGAVAEREVHIRYKFDKETVKMIQNIIQEILTHSEQGDTLAGDEEPDYSAMHQQSSSARFDSMSSSRNSLASTKSNRKRKSSKHRFNASTASATLNEEPDPPIRIVWIIDELDAVDRGPMRTQNFIRDFVSPAGRHGESLQVLRRLFSTPVRSIDSVLCFSRDQRNRDACVFHDEYFPARRFVLERWTHAQSEAALFEQLVTKMNSIFDPSVVDQNRLHDLAHEVASSNKTFFGHNGPFRGSPYLIENFAEIICHFARKAQPVDAFDPMKFTLPSPQSLTGYIRQFASPLVLF